jgi:hypothetical protein
LSRYIVSGLFSFSFLMTIGFIKVGNLCFSEKQVVRSIYAHREARLDSQNSFYIIPSQEHHHHHNYQAETRQSSNLLFLPLVILRDLKYHSQ